jgi:hypothetical protein
MGTHEHYSLSVFLSGSQSLEQTSEVKPLQSCDGWQQKQENIVDEMFLREYQ